MGRFVIGAVVLSFLGWAYPVQAQVLYTLESPIPDSDGCFGWSVSGAGDVDNDGHDDVIVGAWREDVMTYQDGRAYVFSGNGGGLLRILESPVGYSTFARLVARGGDLDKDGHDDLLVTGLGGNVPYDPNNYGMVLAFSGLTGAVLHGWTGPGCGAGYDGFACSAGGAGDANNDGFDDVIVGHGGPARAYVFSGNDGGALDTLVSPNPEAASSFSYSVSGLGDVNGDGHSDLLVGAHNEDGGAPDAGRAYVFSGSDGTVLHTLESAHPESAGYFGSSVSDVADVNADGCDDIVVGASLEDGGVPDAGRAYVFSGSDGTLLYTLVSPFPETYGAFSRVAGAGDVNADGYGDVVIGAPNEDGGGPEAGRAYVFSGNGGSLLYVLESAYPESAGRFGFSVSGGGDMNADGRSEVIVGAYKEDGGAVDAGRVYVFDGMQVPVELSSFTAQALNGHILLQWTTQTEQDNYGFHVYRAVTEPGDYQRITGDIIPGAGTSTIPHHYSYRDRDVEAGLTYSYKLADVDVGGNQTFHGPVSVTVAPARFALLGNQPNPFSEATTIRLSLSSPGRVSLKIYNSAGDLVSTLADAEMTAGTHEIRWDGYDDGGRALSPGTYTCRLRAGDIEQSRRMVLIR